MQRFQSFWFGDDLPPYQRLAMKSFVDFGHDYVLYAYRKFDVPAGVVLRDANEILPQSRIFFYGERAETGQGSVSAFSNLFRYHLLHELGGWWVDTDVICLSAAIPSSEIFMGWEYDDLIGSAILKFSAGHGFVRELRDVAERAGTDLEWGTTGPFLLTRLVGERDLLGSVSPQPFAYPLQSRDAVHLLIPARRDEIRERIRNSPFLHMWNEILRRAVVFPWMAPPPGSLIAELFERHGIGFGNAPVYTAQQVQRLNDNYYTFTYWDWDRKQLTLAQSQLAEAKAETAWLHKKLGEIRQSPSWRITAPVREMERFLRRLRRGR